MVQTMVRKPAAVGMFYPANPDELQGLIKKYLQAVSTFSSVPKALIAPHAGYIYSGPVAATAYAQLLQIKDQINKVILLGPSHRVPFFGLATTHVNSYLTPLGEVPIDHAAVQQISSLPQVKHLEDAHVYEHSLEVHLPFLQTILMDFSLVPLVVGEANPEDVAEVLTALWGGEETLIVISSDLSHYHNYQTAQQLDQATSQAIENLQPDKIQHEQACGRYPINGLLHTAKDKGLTVETVDLRNSGDTAGPRNQVVGYGAYVFH